MCGADRYLTDRLEELSAPSQLAQRDAGGIANGAAGAGPQRCQAGDQGSRGVLGKAGSQVIGAGLDQGPGLVDGLDPLGAGTALGDHQRPDRLDGAVPALRRTRGRGSQVRQAAGACHPSNHRKEMTLTIVETRAITGGVDTHADVHVAAALDPVGGLPGVREFPVTPSGYARLLDWLGGFGTVCLVGIEGTGSYAAGLARHVTAAGVRIVEAVRSDRQDRRRQGKSDPLDAVSAARAAQSGRARGVPKGRDGTVEAIRVLMVAQRSARSERIQTSSQARALVLTGPGDLRARFARHAVAALVAELVSLRPRPGSTVGYATRIALRELGRRAVPRYPARTPRSAHRPSGDSACPRPSCPLRDRRPHRGAAAHRCRGPP